RNTIVSQRVLTDTAFCESIKKVWMVIGKGSPPPDKKSTMAYFLEDLKIFKARGGNVILVRCPSSGMVRAGEDRAMPRQQFWDELVKASNVRSYHYADYPQLPSECPEWSHLSGPDAQVF